MDTSKAATKADIKSLRLETKADNKSLRQEILKVEEHLENVEEHLDSVETRLETKIDKLEQNLNAKLNKIANTLDGFVGIVDDLRTDNTVGAHHTQELQLKVEDHEKRIKQFESSAT